MTRIVWGTVGERFYEVGSDHGVLYVNGGGYPWNGLKSVTESPTGGEPTPYYLDGIKYLNLTSAEEFEATLSAFSAPEEFNLCDGSLALYSGLYLTQQPRRSFGLSYRTRVGNDIDGADHGYKIHVVYNALAKPTNRENRSLSNSADPNALDWAITTTPPKATGFKPTAHVIIDSRHTDPEVLSSVEDLLYGTNISNPTLPTIQELIDIFNSGGL